MSKHWYKSFITHSQKYCLLDATGDIRATAYDLEGISLAKQHFGWGDIHKMNFKDNVLEIGKKLK